MQAEGVIISERLLLMQEKLNRPRSFSSVQLFSHFGYAFFLCVSQPSTRKRICKWTTIGKMPYQRVSLSHSFRLSQQMIFLQLSGTPQPPLHCYLQLFLSVSNAISASRLVICDLQLNASQRFQSSALSFELC